MSQEVHPLKYFVPALPLQYICEFGQESNTTEAVLLRLVLDTGPSTAPSAAIVVKGPGGTGKTTSLLGVGNAPQTWARFTDAVWFTSLGRNARPSALLEELETVVRAVVGMPQAEEIGRLSKARNKASAVSEAIRVLNDHAVLLLIDDVWADELAHVGESTVFSLVQDCMLRIQRNTGRLRIIVSTRDAGIASLVPRSCRVAAEPFQARDPCARAMLCSYAGVSFEDIRSAVSSIQESFCFVLDRCGGLQLALAVAGCGVHARTEFGGMAVDDVWRHYAAELAKLAEVVKTSHRNHPGVYEMVQSSLDHVRGCLNRDGIVLPDDIKVLFSLLAVLKKQEAVPLSVVSCIWGTSKELAYRLCMNLAQLHLMSLTESDGVPWISVHHVIIDFCDVVLNETPGRKSFAHRMMAEGLETMLLGDRRIDDDGEWGGCAAFWQLCDVSLDEWARDYCVRNIARHKVAAGGVYVQRLLHLITDYRWAQARIQLSKDENDLSGIVEDVEALLSGYEEDLDQEVKIGLELISDAVRLSTPYIATNPRELAYQLQGRLEVHAGLNAVVDRFLWSLEKFAKRPWLKVGKGVLKPAGGPVILRATLPKFLRCVALLPNGQDVVVGGADGYLGVYSIRYASELYELCGHRGSIRCIAFCTAKDAILSGGQDGTIRTWDLGTRQQVGDAFLHERPVLSLAVTADGSHVVFGNDEGWLTVCDPTSGDVIRRWRGHSTVVSSLAIRGEDRMIVSASWDGTIGRWEFVGGREIGPRIDVGCAQVTAVVVSRDGKRIVYSAEEKVGVLSSESGNVLRECRTDWKAFCVTFGADDEVIFFGRGDGTTAAMSPHGHVVNEVKAHSIGVAGIVQSREGQFLVSVSSDCTLSVQNLSRRDSCFAGNLGKQYELEEFVVLPDRKRVLFSWFKGPRGLQLLDLSTTRPEAALNEEDLMNTSITIGSTEAEVSAVAASRDGHWGVAGTEDGEVVIYGSDIWHPKHPGLHRLEGLVFSVAFSNDGSFLAAGSSGGDIALFRLGDGRAVDLPSSDELDGIVIKVAFSEDSSMLFAIVDSQSAGMVHIWRYIHHARSITHVALPFSKISNWVHPVYPTSLIATSAHVATRYLTDSEAYVYDFAKDQSFLVAREEEDDSGLLRITNQEHELFQMEGALFMAPFERAIRYCHEQGSDVLGTLEVPIWQSFHPDQWTFNEDAGIFLAGGYRSGLVSALLVEENAATRCDEAEAPRLPSVHKTVGLRVNSSLTSSAAVEYAAFISHAGPDKTGIARPLYRRLVERGVDTFVDKDELRVGGVAVPKMEAAMEKADVGVFITSPEFVCREWPMKELSCFLRRREEAEAKGGRPPVVVPVFYRLGVHECRRGDVFNVAEVNEAAVKAGFYSAKVQKEIPIAKVVEWLKGLARFTGIENEEGVVNEVGCVGSRVENERRRVGLIERIVEGVLEARARRDEEFERG